MPEWWCRLRSDRNSSSILADASDCRLAPEVADKEIRQRISYQDIRFDDDIATELISDGDVWCICRHFSIKRSQQSGCKLENTLIN